MSDISARPEKRSEGYALGSVDVLIALGRKQDELYRQWGKILSALHQEKAISLEIEKHKDNIVREFACMRAAVATEIGRRMLSPNDDDAIFRQECDSDA